MSGVLDRAKLCMGRNASIAGKPQAASVSRASAQGNLMCRSCWAGQEVGGDRRRGEEKKRRKEEGGGGRRREEDRGGERRREEGRGERNNIA